ncbi:MAG: 30S ribosomal protein S8 [Alphaproteobacteria bacterium CG11_big_fil_rev_8_21_14_0_20_44_7]|nr:MAG: 30S ribosomal protein S8 [Alphaproteobacteria bacterium CG11_big_fil_rev_8_21_14_0_20_44_7]
MSMSDPLANMLAAIRNGQQANKSSIIVPASKLKKSVLKVLEEEGYIRGFADAETKDAKPGLKIELKYFEGVPVIKSMQKLSKPGRRVYASVGKFPKVYNGLGIIVVSTSKGVMCDYEARQQKVGGELLCSVF